MFLYHPGDGGWCHNAHIPYEEGFIQGDTSVVGSFVRIMRKGDMGKVNGAFLHKKRIFAG